MTDYCGLDEFADAAGHLPPGAIDARRSYRGQVSALIIAAAAIATTALIGWTFSIEPMKRIAPGLTSMNPLTAVSLECASLTLWLLRDARPKGAAGFLAMLLTIFVLLVGLSKMADLAFGTSLCPDAVLFAAQLNAGQEYPSRIAPQAAFCFAFMGAALLAIDRPRLPAILHPQLLAAPVLCLAIAGLVGYAYDTRGFYKFTSFIPMALHTATCFVLLASALILSRPDQGYLRLLPRGSPGARSYSRLLPVCLLVPALLGRLALWGTDRGWFEGRAIAASGAAVLTMLAMSILAFLNSIELNRTERVRRAAEQRLQTLVHELDRRNVELGLEMAERRRMEVLAAHQASHDFLTGLPNRMLFLDRLETAIGRAVRHGDAFALFYFDIDNFKPVNDRYGHHAGDELLKELARRLQTAVRAVDTMARIGGDEFAAIIDGPVQPLDAEQLAERVGAAFDPPFRLIVPEQAEFIEVTVGVSVGVALFPGHANDLDTLLNVADLAMYRAKLAGKANGQGKNIAFAT